MAHPFKELTINKSRLAHYKMNSVQAGVIECHMNAGSVYETELFGIMHLMEHMLFQSTRKFKDNQDMELFKEMNGITSNGWTNILHMGFWNKFPYISFNKAADLMEEMLFYPVFKEKDLNIEREVIKQEIVDTYSSPYRRFSEQIRKQLYGEGHPYSRDVFGTKKTLDQISLDDLSLYHKKYVVPANLHIGSSSRLSYEKIFNKFEKILSAKTAGTSIKEKTSDVRPGNKYLWHAEDVDQVGIHLQWLLPGREKLGRKERMKINAAMYILGGSSRSMLTRRLRHELGYVYGVAADYYSWEKTSVVDLSASTSQKNANNVASEMISILHQFIDNKISEDVFNRSIKFLNMRSMLKYNSVDNIADDLASDLLIYDRVTTPEENIEMANTLTELQARNILKKYITPSNLYISVIAKKDPNLASILF